MKILYEAGFLIVKPASYTVVLRKKEFIWLCNINHIHLIIQSEEGKLSDLVRDFKKIHSEKYLRKNSPRWRERPARECNQNQKPFYKRSGF